MIVSKNPESDEKLKSVDQAWFDSDLGDNVMAIKEINAEAAQYGLVRTREYWLQTFLSPAGTVVRRGFCFRPGPSSVGERLAAARQHDLVGVASSDIVREMRDTE